MGDDSVVGRNGMVASGGERGPLILDPDAVPPKGTNWRSWACALQRAMGTWPGIGKKRCCFGYSSGE